MDRSAYLLSRAMGPWNRLNEDNTEVLITECIYDGSGNPTYYGIAPQGSLTSESKWRVEKLIYDGSGNYLRSRYTTPNQIFDNYASLTYT
jgi:hypothetical protein